MERAGRAAGARPRAAEARVPVLQSPDHAGRHALRLLLDVHRSNQTVGITVRSTSNFLIVNMSSQRDDPVVPQSIAIVTSVALLMANAVFIAWCLGIGRAAARVRISRRRRRSASFNWVAPR